MLLEGRSNRARCSLKSELDAMSHDRIYDMMPYMGQRPSP